MWVKVSQVDLLLVVESRFPALEGCPQSVSGRRTMKNRNGAVAIDFGGARVAPANPCHALEVGIQMYRGSSPPHRRLVFTAEYLVL